MLVWAGRGRGSGLESWSSSESIRNAKALKKQAISNLLPPNPDGEPYLSVRLCDGGMSLWQAGGSLLGRGEDF